MVNCNKIILGEVLSLPPGCDYIFFSNKQMTERSSEKAFCLAYKKTPLWECC